MTTNLRRITITLLPEVDAALLAMAKAEGKPQAKIVSDILVEFAPMMAHLALLHQQIKEGKKVDAKQTVRHMLGDQMANLFASEPNPKIDRKK